MDLTVISTYRVRSDALGDFRDLLGRHWPILRELELVTATPPQYYAGAAGDDGGVPVVEIFEWSSESAAQQAHTHPAISEIWERMATMWAPGGAAPVRTHLAVHPLAVAH
ncbi:hypothetical protein ACPPVO_18510 [Dactylosporangium sp. McL0621]|uniref:hypothetical protein n=1 Tax=Dactylosporangium sp. McL0621 TaxID=3415678 RepID=UPI003CFA1E07